MKIRLITLIAFLAIVSVIFVNCKSSKNLSVGTLQGPGTVDEGSAEVFSVEVENGKNVTYQWAVDPPTAGIILPQGSKATFNADYVTEELKVSISVTVNASNGGPTVKSKDIMVLDSDSCSPDITPPMTQITSGCPSGMVDIKELTLYVSSIDNCTEQEDIVIEWLAFRDGVPQGDWTADDMPDIMITGLTLGNWEIQVRGVDEAGNMDLSPPSCDFEIGIIDNQPPDTQIVSGCGDKPAGTTQVTFTVTATDDYTPTANLVYEYNFYREGTLITDWTQTTDTQITVSGLVDNRNYQFNVRAYDELGAVDPTPATCNFKVLFEDPCANDTSPPDTQITSGCMDYPPGTSSISLGVTGTDNCTPFSLLHYEWQSYVNFSLLVTPWTMAYSTPISIFPLYSGHWQVYVRAIDEKNNKDQSPALCEFNIG